MAVSKHQSVFDLWLHLYGDDLGSFQGILFTLIAKADRQNLERLKLAFPVQVSTWEEWQSSESEELFFNKYNIKTRG